MEDVIGGMLGGLVVMLLVFLILREVMCWYWKINEVVGLLKEISVKLDQRPASALAGNAVGAIASRSGSSAPAVVVCRSCSAVYDTARAPKFCEQCGGPIG